MHDENVGAPGGQPGGVSKYLFVVGLVFFAGLVWFFGWGEIAERLAGASLVPLGWMTLLIVGGFWIRAWKWRYALGAGRSGVGLFFLAKMAGNWTPGRVGELSPLLLKAHRTVNVGAWIVADRVIEIVVTVGLGLVGLSLLGLLPTPVSVLLVVGGIVDGGVGLWVVFRGALPKSWGARWGSATWRGRLVKLAGALHAEFRLLGGKSVLIVVSTLVAKATDIWAVILLCRAFGFDVSFLLVCVARFAHALVSGVPVTPDATGVPFVAAAYFLHEHASIPYATLTAALGLEVVVINVVLYLSFLVGALDLRSSR
jgi:hypothetical protein